MTAADLIITLNAQSLPESQADAVPDWIHLLPAGSGGTIQTDDARGPYHVDDAEEIIAASFREHEKLPVDVNHSTDLAAPQGLDAPAVGWIHAIEHRADGLWGRVEWNQSGRDLLAGKAYSSISPVILHDRKGRKVIRRILRASLVNVPNFKGLAALNTSQGNDMMWKNYLIEMMSLDASADDEAIKAALRKATKASGDTATQSKIAGLLGLNDDAPEAEIVTALQAALETDTGARDATVTALQSEVRDLALQLTTERETRRREAAETFIDGAIADRRVGLKAARETWITRHMADPEGIEAEINALPALDPTHTAPLPPGSGAGAGGGALALNATQAAVAAQLGMSTEDYRKALEAERAKQEAV